MNKKNSFKKVAALLLGVALAAGSTGCNFVVTDNEKDLAQTVAEVNISASLKKDPDSEYAAVADSVADIVKNLSTDISKRDLIAYFLSTGYQYVQNYGYTYEATFNMLMEGLVSREIMIQYAIAYYLKENSADINVAGCNAYIEAELGSASLTDKEKELLKAHPEVLTLKYFLSEGGKADVTEDFDRAVYTLKKSFNDSLDSLEESYIKAQSEEHDHEEARTLPTAVGTEKEDYYTNNYEVYTGLNTAGSCGEYERLDGSTPSTRQDAYNAFLANLQGYNMISTSGSIEDTSDVIHLNYYYVELSSLLGQFLVNKYYDDLAEDVTAEIDEAYAKAKYDEIYAAQEKKYQSSPSAFSTAMDSVSDTSFLLYGLKDFGYVYNILIPFSTSQNVEYTAAKNNAENTQDDLYNKRKAILNRVEGTDLRGSWISDHDHANYSYEKDGMYFFFENHLAESTKYEKLKQYAGNYAYQGTVSEDMECDPDEINIDTFIQKMEAYINLTVSGDENTVIASGAEVAAYEKDKNDTVYTDDKGVVDYSKFVYYKGKADLGSVSAKDYFDANSNVYKAVSAVNELMFAYSTDPGCLNTYFGYSVSPYGTNFVKEFEYAAQEAVKGGVGTYVVCATDYGWHIIFASYVYSADGDVYGGYNHAEAVGETMVEGSFSNLFYESLKSTASSSYSSEIQNSVLNRYNNDDCVTLYKARYKDLLELK